MSNQIIDVTPTNVVGAVQQQPVTNLAQIVGYTEAGIPIYGNRAPMAVPTAMPNTIQAVPIQGSGAAKPCGCAAKRAAMEAQQAALAAGQPVPQTITTDNVATAMYPAPITNERVASMPGQAMTLTAPTSVYNTDPTTVETKAIALNENFKILWHTVGFGRIGLGRSTGFGPLIIPPADMAGWSYISAHAPSAVLVNLTKPAKIAGFFNTGSNPNSSCTFWASGNYIGQVDRPGISTNQKYGEFTLPAGEHLLEIVVDGQSNASCHTIWAFWFE